MTPRLVRAMLVLPLASVLCIGAVAAAATPLGSAFTYQGRLNLNGNPVNGLTDLRLSLWDADTNGNQIGPTLTFAAGGDGPPVNFANGLFAVDLDFGATAFNGSARWLNVEVRFPAGSGSYTPLVPRQSINPTAHAMYARSGGDSLLRGMTEYSTPGSHTFTVPEGVTRLLVEAWSAGGGGGAGLGQLQPTARQEAGSGGGSGAYVRTILPVTPGENLTIAVGAGGAGALPGGPAAQPGGATTISRGPTTLVSILGGQPGNSASGGMFVAGAAGGTVQLNSGSGFGRPGHATIGVDWSAPTSPPGACPPTPSGNAIHSYVTPTTALLNNVISAPPISGTIEPRGAYGGIGGTYYFPTPQTLDSCPGTTGGDGFVLIQW